jgi:hypothetical protein
MAGLYLSKIKWYFRLSAIFLDAMSQVLYFSPVNEEIHMRSQLYSTFMTFLIAMPLLAGCSKINDMHDATVDMDHKMDETNSQLKDMHDVTKQMHDSTVDMDNKMVDMDNKMDQTNSQLVDTNAKLAQTQLTMNQLVNNTALLDSTTIKMTDSLNQTLAQIINLSTSTTGLSNTTQNMYFALRQSYAETIRQYALNNMINTTALESKIAYAGVYMNGWEFQVWSGQGTDDLTRRQFLFNDFYAEFMLSMKAFWTTDTSKMSLDPTSSDPKMEDLFAISASVQQVNQIQIQQIPLLQSQGMDVKQVSVLDLIHNALLKNQALEAGTISLDSLSQAEKDTIQDSQAYTYLLQVRANFLPMLVLSKLANLEYAAFCQKIATFLFGFDADLNPADTTAEQLENYAQYLTWANAESDFLKSIGSPPQFNSKLVRLYNGMRMADVSTLPTANQSSYTHLTTQLTALKAAMAGSGP